MRYVAVKCLLHCILLYRLRGMWFMIVHEYILAACIFRTIAIQMKSRNWLEIQISTLKSRNPKSTLNLDIHSEIRNPHEIQ